MYVTHLLDTCHVHQSPTQNGYVRGCEGHTSQREAAYPIHQSEQAPFAAVTDRLPEPCHYLTR